MMAQSFINDNNYFGIKLKKKKKKKRKKNIKFVYDTRERPYKCEICGNRFLKNQHLQKHQRLHQRPDCYSCPYCDKEYKFAKCCQRHIPNCPNQFHEQDADNSSESIIRVPVPIFKHGQNTPTVSRSNDFRKDENYDLIHTDKTSCYLFKKRSLTSKEKSLKMIRKRRKTWIKPLFRCTFVGCNNMYTSRDSLNYHIKCHMNDRPNLCYCGKGYILRRQLTHHIATCHKVSILNKCPYCYYRTYSEGQYFRHLSRHPEF